jgi:hypothetical protein
MQQQARSDGTARAQAQAQCLYAEAAASGGIACLTNSVTAGADAANAAACIWAEGLRQQVYLTFWQGYTPWPRGRGSFRPSPGA